MAIYFLVVFGAYFLLLLVLWIGWRSASQSKVDPAKKNIFISIVVAMRNESENLERLLRSLAQQSYPASSYEILLVDDHSGDDSLSQAKEWIDRISNLTVISLDENQNGKKAALSLGVRLAKGEVIVTTDADCVVPTDWLQKINEGFQRDETNMLIGSVALRDENNFFSKLQSIEFASVIGTGIALVALGKPTMCNGANLSFRKKAFDEVKGYSGNEHIASGDDEFLMRKMEDKFPNSIRVIKDNIVTTSAQASLKDFVQQRLRWASKWKSNSSLFARYFALLMVVIQVSWILLPAWMLYHPSAVCTVIFVLKVSFDLLFLASVCRFLKMKFNLAAFVGLQFLYSFYVLYIGIFSQVKNHEWKGRAVADFANAR